MPKSYNQKIKILLIMKELLTNSEPNSPISTTKLIEMLENNNIRAERKSIYADIAALKEFGFDIISIKGKNNGFYLASREFELPELKLLVDAVQSSKFITIKKSEVLIKKLESMCSKTEARQLKRQVYISGRIKSMNESIYYNVDAVQEGLINNKTITFKYFEWSPKGEMELRRDGKVYEISPIGLLWQDENYYLVGIDNEILELRHYRVDKMTSIKVSEKERIKTDESAEEIMSNYGGMTFGMYGGDSKTITLIAKNHMAGVIIDRFGKDCYRRKYDDSHFIVRVDVIESPQFYGWLMGLGNEVVIEKPESTRKNFLKYIDDVKATYYSIF
ncbi:MAG: helix-turn-helix transcriptional regulator [Suipraeoptans sp.]